MLPSRVEVPSQGRTRLLAMERLQSGAQDAASVMASQGCCDCVCCSVLQRIAAVLGTVESDSSVSSASHAFPFFTLPPSCTGERYDGSGGVKSYLATRALEFCLSKGFLMAAESVPETRSCLPTAPSTILFPATRTPGFSLLPSPFPQERFEQVRRRRSAAAEKAEESFLFLFFPNSMSQAPCVCRVFRCRPGKRLRASRVPWTR